MVQLARSDLCASNQQMVTDRNSELKIKIVSDLSKILARRSNSRYFQSIPRLSLPLLTYLLTIRVRNLRNLNSSLNIHPVPKVTQFFY